MFYVKIILICVFYKIEILNTMFLFLFIQTKLAIYNILIYLPPIINLLTILINLRISIYIYVCFVGPYFILRDPLRHTISGQKTAVRPAWKDTSRILFICRSRLHYESETATSAAMRKLFFSSPQ